MQYAIIPIHVPNNSENLVHKYISEMRARRSTGATTPETSFYTPLDNLLNEVGRKLTPKVIFSTQVSSSTSPKQPDGGFFPLNRTRRAQQSLHGGRPERGVVEIKPVEDDINQIANRQQVLDYLRDFGIVLITNYRQFRLLRLTPSGEIQTFERYDLTISADDFWHSPINALATRHKDTLPDFLTRVLLYKVPIEKPEDLANLLASYAREARARAEDHPLAAFEGVKSALQESLGITFEGEKGEHFFRSTLIQTLFYGMFSAWILWRRSPDYAAHGGVFEWRRSAEYLRLAVLRTLFYAIAEPGALRSADLPEVLDRAADALNRVRRDFFTTFREEDAVQYFYEPFLEAFDPELRKQLGVWYTPREIVRYMVERVDTLLRTELNEPLGLASPRVQVLDPCCGTGAYLVEVLHRIERTLRERAGDDTSSVGPDLRRAAITRIFGFEIMPAPFVISHLQIAQLLEDARASLSATQRAQVFLTNALTGWVPARHPQSNFGFPAFAQERDAAEAVKQAETILVILGNPPYNGYAGIADIDEERNLTEAYRVPVDGVRAPQGQGLNELYVRFFRIAERRVVGDGEVRGNRTGTGIVSFISGSRWLDGLSHPTMRWRLLSEFNPIYIDNLNGDKFRNGKTTPDGKPDPSAFSTPLNREGIQVGTAITTLVRRGHSHASDEIHLRDLWGIHKLSQLDREAKAANAPEYNTLTPSPRLGLLFAERPEGLSYSEWPRITEIFRISLPGVKTSRDPLLIDIDRERLAQRMRAYFNRNISNSEMDMIAPGTMENGYMYPAAEIRETLQWRGFREWEMLRYTYRPFDLRWIYWEPETSLLRRKVEDFTGQLIGSTQWIEARQREAGDFFSRGTVVRGLADNFGNGYSSFFPAEIISGPNLLSSNTHTEPNLTVNVVRYLGAITGAPEHDSVFFHALAMMHTAQYRRDNAGALLNDWPRIPLPATAELLTASANLGRRLAELLDPESSVELPSEWRTLGRLILPPEAPEGTNNRDEANARRYALTAGWGGPGQGGTVMPRRGKTTERDYTVQERERIATLAAQHNLCLDQAIALLGPRCVDLYLNGDAYWTCVPQNVWDYTLGGYQVLKKWLSYRELPLLGRPLREDEAAWFSEVVRRIAGILLLGPALDANYAAILPTATGLPAGN